MINRKEFSTQGDNNNNNNKKNSGYSRNNSGFSGEKRNDNRDNKSFQQKDPNQIFGGDFVRQPRQNQQGQQNQSFQGQRRGQGQGQGQNQQFRPNQGQGQGQPFRIQQGQDQGQGFRNQQQGQGQNQQFRPNQGQGQGQPFRNQQQGQDQGQGFRNQQQGQGGQGFRNQQQGQGFRNQQVQGQEGQGFQPYRNQQQGNQQFNKNNNFNNRNRDGFDQNRGGKGQNLNKGPILPGLEELDQEFGFKPTTGDRRGKKKKGKKRKDDDLDEYQNIEDEEELMKQEMLEKKREQEEMMEELENDRDWDMEEEDQDKVSEMLREEFVKFDPMAPQNKEKLAQLKKKSKVDVKDVISSLRKGKRKDQHREEEDYEEGEEDENEEYEEEEDEDYEEEDYKGEKKNIYRSGELEELIWEDQQPQRKLQEDREIQYQILQKQLREEQYMKERSSRKQEEVEEDEEDEEEYDEDDTYYDIDDDDEEIDSDFLDPVVSPSEIPKEMPPLTQTFNYNDFKANSIKDRVKIIVFNLGKDIEFMVNRDFNRFNLVRVIDNNGKFVGDMKGYEANKLAQARGLDLVLKKKESKNTPTITKLMPMSDYLEQFEAAVREKMEIKKQPPKKVLKLKTLVLTSKISKHDFDVKVNSAIKFLEKGHPVEMVCSYQSDDQEVRHGERLKTRVIRALDGVGSVTNEYKQPANKVFTISFTKVEPEELEQMKKKAEKKNKKKQLVDELLDEDEDGNARVLQASKDSPILDPITKKPKNQWGDEFTESEHKPKKHFKDKMFNKKKNREKVNF
eukprot:gene675-835_t